MFVIELYASSSGILDSLSEISLAAEILQQGSALSLRKGG